MTSNKFLDAQSHAFKEGVEAYWDMDNMDNLLTWQQLENRAAYYEKGDRRKRAHHLITRGAAIESVASLTKVLTETEFYAFALCSAGTC